MPERKVWSEEEDKILRYLREQRQERKWASIARIMEQEFGIEGRTGKQCRQRYHNHLDAGILSTQWTPLEDQLLFQLHEELGNKWSAISHKIPGRSDNCVKNHFYSKLRKAVRKLNRLIQEQLEGHQFKPIKSCMLSKILEITQCKFKPNSKEDEEFVQLCNDIKNRLFKLEMQVAEEMPVDDLEVCRRVIEKIEEFDRSYRKWHKPSKRGSGEGEGEYRIYLKPPKPIKRQNSNGSCSSDLSDDASSFLSSSCISSCSDLSEYDNKSKHTNSTFKGSPNTSAGNIKVEQQMKGEVVDPVEFIKEHQQLVMEESDNDIMQNQMKPQAFEYNNMFYDDTPVMARIFAPNYPSMDEEHESALFRGRDSDEIVFAEERGSD